ncbi:MAG: hypothetical protein CVT86_05490 [Alphaproteobacteria bacterium HGW-Alphaproteobacteria-8]|jgi:hypothetical protein|nr:MAG: hypothetical protein CVT86_05490 [Alphaproteobacteria bacterium HGW-Alphaproteobacteria-8]
MICAPHAKTSAVPASAFDFSESPDATSRMMSNAAVMWAAPWRAYWALAFEALDPQNYRR